MAVIWDIAQELTFTDFQKKNARRCMNAFDTCKDWKATEWALAICGEAGELANLVKKIRRGDFSLESQRTEMLKELADIVTYCDLMTSYLGGNTAEELIMKFNEVSERIKAQEKFT